MKRSTLLKGSRLFTLYAFTPSSAADFKIKTIRGERERSTHTDRLEFYCMILPVYGDAFNIPMLTKDKLLVWAHLSSLITAVLLLAPDDIQTSLRN